MRASRVCRGIISFINKIIERLWPRVSYHYNLHEKVQIVGVSPNGMHAYKLRIVRVSGIGERLRSNYLEARKRINAETIVSGWLTVRSCPPPSTVMSSE